LPLRENETLSMAKRIGGKNAFHEIVRHGRFSPLEPGEEPPILETDSVEITLSRVEFLIEHGEEAHVLVYGKTRAVCEGRVAELVQGLVFCPDAAPAHLGDQ
jgi:hypothetical protein